MNAVSPSGLLRSQHMLPLIAAGLAVLSLFPSRACASDSARQRFLQEAPMQWKAYCQFLTKLQGTGRYEWVVQGKLESCANSTFTQNEHGRLCIREFPLKIGTPSPSGYVWCSNPDYAFSLIRRGEQVPWVIVSSAPVSNRQLYQEVSDKAATAINSQFKGSIGLSGITLSELIDKPNFGVVREEAGSDGAGTVRVEFTNKQQPVDRMCPILGGWLLLDPANHWVLRKSETLWRFDDHDEIREEDYEYLPGLPAYPIPQRISVRRISAEGDQKLLGTATDQYVLSLGPAPQDSKFTFMAFGLPELRGLTARQPWYNRWYLWTAVVAIGCFIVAFLLRRRIRHAP
jgi:hypothetical protein